MDLNARKCLNCKREFHSADQCPACGAHVIEPRTELETLELQGPKKHVHRVPSLEEVIQSGSTKEAAERIVAQEQAIADAAEQDQLLLKPLAAPPAVVAPVKPPVAQQKR